MTFYKQSLLKVLQSLFNIVKTLDAILRDLSSNRWQHDDIRGQVHRQTMSIVPTGSLDKLIIRLPQTSEEITMRHILVQCALKIHSDHKSSAHSIRLDITSFTSITRPRKQHENSMKLAWKQKLPWKAIQRHQNGLGACPRDIWTWPPRCRTSRSDERCIMPHHNAKWSETSRH